MVICTVFLFNPDKSMFLFGTPTCFFVKWLTFPVASTWQFQGEREVEFWTLWSSQMAIFFHQMCIVEQNDIEQWFSYYIHTYIFMLTILHIQRIADGPQNYVFLLDTCEEFQSEPLRLLSVKCILTLSLELYSTTDTRSNAYLAIVLPCLKWWPLTMINSWKLTYIT